MDLHLYHNLYKYDEFDTIECKTEDISKTTYRQTARSKKTLVRMFGIAVSLILCLDSL